MQQTFRQVSGEPERSLMQMIELGEIPRPAVMAWNALSTYSPKLSYHDPYVSEIEIEGENFLSQKLCSSLLEEMDLVLITAKHENIDYDLILEHSKKIFDTRNAYAHIDNPKIIRL